MKVSSILWVAVASLSIFLGLTGAKRQKHYKDCSTSLSTLEKALYETAENKVQLNNYFFPPREEFVPYAKVVYTFEGKHGKKESGSCVVTFVWAIGGFLLIQPPSIFTYSSLYFFHTRIRDDFTLHLTLPHACRPLVEEKNGRCSCANKENKALDILTQQIRHYAKFNDPKKIEVGTNVLTQAECYDNLDRDYLNSTKTRVYLSYCLCIPLIVITILVVVVRTLKVPITTKLSNSLNHPSVAGLVLTGIFLHLFCLAMDMAAVYYMHLDIELKDIPRNVNPRNSLNFFATGITLGFNVLISFTLIVCSAYIHCKHIIGPRRFFFRHIFQRVLSPIFYVVFGEFDQESFWKCTYKDEQERSDDDNRQIRRHTVWVVCFMLLAPLFSLISHIGYIFAAWLTEPSKTTSVALIFLGITVFLFIVFRQCYIANEKVEVEKWFCNWFLLCRPCWQVLKCMCNCICLCLCMKTLKTFRKKKTPVSLLEQNKEETTEGKVKTIDTILKENLESDHVFNTKSFCVTFAWGLPLVGSVAFFLSAFYELPIASYTLPLYLLNAFQVFIVIITLLITYKVLNITEPVIHVFLRYLKKAYSEHVQQLDVPEEGRVKMEGEEVASAATLIGELVGVVIHELQKSPTKKGGTENETQGKKAYGAGGTQTQDQMQGKARGAGSTQMQEQMLGKKAHNTEMTTEVERHNSHVGPAVSQASIPDETTRLIPKNSQESATYS